MKNILKLFFLIIIVGLFSCSSAEFEEHQDVVDLKWHRKDIKTFNVEIKETAKYDLYFMVRYVTGYPYKNIKVEITMINPAKSEKSKDCNFIVRDKDNNYIGDVAGNLWDFEEVFSEDEPLEKGNYVFKIVDSMNSDPVLGVVDIGLKIKKKK